LIAEKFVETGSRRVIILVLDIYSAVHIWIAPETHPPKYSIPETRTKVWLAEGVEKHQLLIES
jgi:hypothetical protein